MAAIYLQLQTYLTYELIRQKVFTFKWLFVIRLLLTIIATLFLISGTIASQFSGHELPPYTVKNKVKPYTNAAAYYYTTACEWTTAISIFLFIFSLGVEFSSINASDDHLKTGLNESFFH